MPVRKVKQALRAVAAEVPRWEKIPEGHNQH
jgi:hypothetical protein